MIPGWAAPGGWDGGGLVADSARGDSGGGLVVEPARGTLASGGGLVVEPARARPAIEIGAAPGGRVVGKARIGVAGVAGVAGAAGAMGAVGVGIAAMGAVGVGMTDIGIVSVCVGASSGSSIAAIPDIDVTSVAAVPARAITAGSVGASGGKFVVGASLPPDKVGGAARGGVVSATATGGSDAGFAATGAGRGGSCTPVPGGRLRRGGSGGSRRPHAAHTASSSAFSALQNGQNLTSGAHRLALVRPTPSTLQIDLLGRRPDHRAHVVAERSERSPIARRRSRRPAR